jgi:hypothetical protein
VSDGLGGLLYHDRVFVAGQTRSGKSELLNVLFSELRVQRVLVDTKGEFAIPDVEPVSDPAAIDWREQTIHYRTTVTGALDEVDELFQACLGRRRLTVCCHELADLCDFQPNRTPPWLNAYISKGGAHGCGFFAGSQRPVQVPSRALTEAQHVFYVVPRLTRRSDHAALAEPMATDERALARELHAAQQEHGRHSFLWWNLRAQDLSRWPPLPENVRSRNIVERTTVA